MQNRRSFIHSAALAGIAGIVASGKAPAFAQTLSTFRIGNLGLGSHGFLGSLMNPPKDFDLKVKIVSSGVWDDYPGVAEAMSRSFGKVYTSFEELTKNSDAVHIEYADYRKVLELARPALESGKPVFINRPFTGSIADAEEVIRLAKAHDAPVMSASSLEFQPVLADIKKFVEEKGPLRVYEAYCPEQPFPWMFPHVINYAHAAFGGGIDSAFFTGDFVMSLEEGLGKSRPSGCSLIVLTYKPRNGEPPIIGMNHVGNHPGSYHIQTFCAKESKMFEAGMTDKSVMKYMFYALYDFYTQRKIPRPYEAILEQHRALVAGNVSRLTGRTVKLDSLGGGDSLPWNDNIRRYLIRRVLKTG